MFSWKKTILALVVIANLFNFGLAQSANENNTTTSSKNTDTATPTASTKGVNPTIGSYGGSNFDKVNLFNGNVSMSFPLASLSSRGGMSAGVVLSYNSKLWYVDKQETRVGGAKNGSSSIAYVPIYNEYDDGQAQLAAGWTIGAGRMRARQSARYLKPAQSICFFDVPAGNVDPKPKTTLTTFSFTAPDGTEYDFRDTIYDGQPKELINCQPVSRGKEFVSKDGTSATFISDTEVVDSFFTDQISAPNGPFGYVYLRDGTRFRIEKGLPVEQRDNNGNIVRYEYDGIRLIRVTDNMDREINVSYGGGALATITIKGFGGAIRTTVVRGRKLSNHLATGQAQLSIDQLFPVETVQLSSPNSTFNPKVVSEVTLPDGHKWEFQYNSYGEVVYVKTPARGVVTYDMGPTPNSPKKGGYDEVNNQIFRRVTNRQTFPSDSGPIEGKVTYTDPTDPTQIDADNNVTVVEEEVNPSSGDSMITRTRHKFSSNPNQGIRGNGVAGTGYRRWLAGKELETEQIDFGGGVMRRSTSLYEQESGVNWIAGATPTALDQPENNPRLVKVISQLLDGGNKTSTVDYTYDEFNNVLTEELKGFDGQIIRRVERTYLRSLNGIDYAGLNRQIAPANNPNLFDTHLKSLILSENIKNKFNATESTSTYEYDNYSDDGLHGVLGQKTLPTNLHDPLFQGTQRIQRGNVTSITRGAGTPEASTIYSQYDVLGNVTAIVGPLANQKTETEYSSASQFTFPTQTKQFVSGGVSGNRVLISNRTYDFDTGLVITSTGFNGDTTTFQYNDQLDRLTREVRPAGFGETTYNYSLPGQYPNTVTVESTLDASRNLTSISKFDGFLRTIEQRRTDHEGEVVSTTEYDAGGRVEKVTNPFRDGQSLTTDGYTTTTYDALDRVKTVNTFAQDGTSTGTVTTEYETNLVTVTDQAGKKRKSETDAAGRLVNVFEPDQQNNLNIVTNYEYDARSNLRQVNQGEQTRLFNYDSLSRLLSATSPESGNNGGNGATFYEYDRASNLVQRTDSRGEVTSYTYDSLNRLATKAYSNSTAEVTPPVSYFYDVAPNTLPTGATSPSGFNYQNTLGRATAVASPTTGENTPTGLFHSYDIGGRITNSSQLLDGRHYTTDSFYNAASLPVGHTYPSGRTIFHTYNIAGQIQAVESNNETISFDNLYTPAGAIRSQQLGNGLYHLMAYNSRLQPTSIGLGFTSFSSDLWKLDYNYSQYDFNSINSATTTPSIFSSEAQNNGNIGSIRLTPGNGTNPIDQFFVYDELNRLKLAKEFAGTPDNDCEITCPPFVFSGNRTGDFNIYNLFEETITQVLYLFGETGIIRPRGIYPSLNESGEATFQLDLTHPNYSGVTSLGLNVDATINIITNHLRSLFPFVNTVIQDDFPNDLKINHSLSIISLGLRASSIGILADHTAVSILEIGIPSDILPGSETSISIQYKLGAAITGSVAMGSSARVDVMVEGLGQVLFSDFAQISSDGTQSGNHSQTLLNVRLPLDVALAGTVQQIKFTVIYNKPSGYSLSPNVALFDLVATTPTAPINASVNVLINNDPVLELSGTATGAITPDFDNRVTLSQSNTIDLRPYLGQIIEIKILGNYNIAGSSILSDDLVVRGIFSVGCTDCTFTGGGSIAQSKKKSFTKSNIIEPSPLAASSSWSQEYDYDRYGNRHTVIGTNAQNLSISTAKNRITDPGYEYDPAGNLIADPSGKLFFYDAENRLVKVAQGDPSNIIAQYFYDGNGWRVRKIANGVTTRFVYDQSGRLLSEYEGEPVPSLDAPTKEHIYGASGMLATVEADKINYHTPDHLGSPRILTDGFTNVISRRDFFPFGEQLDASLGNRSSVFGYSTTDSIRQKFTGYFRDDESGLDFAQARHFNGALGRFMQPDEFTGGPIEFYDFASQASSNPTFYGTLTKPQSLNKYQYTLNNPLKYFDPNGHQEKQKPGLLEQAATSLKATFGSLLEYFGGARFKDGDNPQDRTNVNRNYGAGVPASTPNAVYQYTKKAGERYNSLAEAITFADPTGITNLMYTGLKFTNKQATAMELGLSIIGAMAFSFSDVSKLSTLGTAGTSADIRVFKGTVADAIDFFDVIAKPGTIKEVKPGVFIAEGQKGGTITFRASSKSGPPTIDLNGIAPGVRKVKFVP